MATRPTKYDIRSSYDEEVAKQYGASSLEDLYKNLLLPSAQTVASQYASQYYAGEQQKAAEVASYDISKAYANYLKQQRNVLNTAQYETGHKEELSSVLQESFKGAKSQARAAESQALQTAAEKASDIYAETYKTESAAAKSLYDTLMKDVNNKTALFKAVESKLLDTTTLENLGLNSGYTTAAGENVTFNIYDTSDGEFKFSDYGMDAVSRLLSSEDFQHYLEEEDLLEYYMTNPQQLNKDLFGVESTDYRLSEESRALSNQRLFGTEGYVESFERPSSAKMDLNANDFYGIDFGVQLTSKLNVGKEELVKYGRTIGLDDSEIDQIIKDFDVAVNSVVKETQNTATGVNNFMLNVGKVVGAGTGAKRDAVNTIYNNAVDAMAEKSKTKYAKK